MAKKCWNCHCWLTSKFYEEYDSIVVCEKCGEINSIQHEDL